MVDVGGRRISRAAGGSCQALTGILSLLTARKRCYHLLTSAIVFQLQAGSHPADLRQSLLPESPGCRALHNPAWET